MSKLPAHPDAARGALAAASGFLFWGLVPVYWKQMQSISAFELIAHRIVWSLVFLLGVIAWQGRFAGLWDSFRSRRLLGLNLLSSVLLTANWTVYVWAVNSGHVIESSLGYFLVPLVNVSLGFLFFHERLRPLQWMAIGCAARARHRLAVTAIDREETLLRRQRRVGAWVDSRNTTSCSTCTMPPASAARMRANSCSVAKRPISDVGWRTVVSAG